MKKIRRPIEELTREQELLSMELEEKDPQFWPLKEPRNIRSLILYEISEWNFPDGTPKKILVLIAEKITKQGYCQQSLASIVEEITRKAANEESRSGKRFRMGVDVLLSMGLIQILAGEHGELTTEDYSFYQENDFDIGNNSLMHLLQAFRRHSNSDGEQA
jgi:hypothetical protein